MPDIAILVNEAARFERLAAGMTDEKTIEALLAMAGEREETAKNLGLTRLLHDQNHPRPFPVPTFRVTSR